MISLRIACVFAPLALVSAGCTGGAPHVTPSAPPVAVSIGVAHREPLAVTYRASGTVRGRNTTTLTSKATGYVRAVHVRAGDRVHEGQKLIDLEANDARATVARSRASLELSTEAKAEAENGLEAAKVAERIAKSSYERVKVLFDEHALPEQQYDEAEAHYRGAVAQVQMAQSRLRGVTSRIDEAKAALGESQATLGYSSIVAPFSGRVIDRRVDPGALASPGAPLLVITDEGTLRVEAPVEESRGDEVKVGDGVTVEIDALPKPVSGTVGEIVPNIDVTSRAFLVKVDLPPDVGALRSGTFARVVFAVGSRARLVVPEVAVTSFGALERVFVVEGGRAHLRMITRGDTIGPWTEVLSGLSVDEQVAAPPPPELVDGAKVEVRK